LRKFPSGRQADVAVAVVVPVVVDVDTAISRVADIDVIAVSIDGIYLFSSVVHRRLSFTYVKDVLYTFSPEFYSGVVCQRQTSPLKTSKKFTLVFTRTLSQTVAGDILARSKDKTSHEVKP